MTIVLTTILYFIVVLTIILYLFDVAYPLLLVFDGHQTLVYNGFPSLHAVCFRITQWCISSLSTELMSCITIIDQVTAAQSFAVLELKQT
jgi:hypothetical protein